RVVLAVVRFLAGLLRACFALSFVWPFAVVLELWRGISSHLHREGDHRVSGMPRGTNGPAGVGQPAPTHGVASVLMGVGEDLRQPLGRQRRIVPRVPTLQPGEGDVIGKGQVT